MLAHRNEHLKEESIEIKLSEELFLTQKDKAEIIEKIDNLKFGILEKGDSLKMELCKAIYIAGAIHVLAIIGSALVIISYIQK